MNKQGFMMTCGNCGRPNVYGSIKHTKECELQEQIAVLVAALEFYAKEDNYTGWTTPDYQWSGESKDYDSSIEGDMGEIARQALAKAEGNQS